MLLVVNCKRLRSKAVAKEVFYQQLLPDFSSSFASSKIRILRSEIWLHSKFGS